MNAQFEVAQRVEAVLGKRLVRVDIATQAQTDLLREQTPQPSGHSSSGSSASSARSLFEPERLFPAALNISKNLLRSATDVIHGVLMSGL